MNNKESVKTSSASKSQPRFSQEDLAKLFNYPAIGELFSEDDTVRLDAFCSKISLTKEVLERIVRHGNKTAADSAICAISGIEITLKFLESLQKMRLAEKK